MFFVDIFVNRITKDFRQKELLPLKLLFFVHASTLFVLYPYLTIHMRELGINVEETAIMSAVTPVVAIIMPPVAGMVADRIGNFRILLSIFSTLGGAASLLLLLVPVGRVTVTYPEQVILDVGCGVGQDRFLELGMSRDIPCNYVPSLKNGKIHEVKTTLEACGFICEPDIGGQITPMSPSPLTNDDQDTSQQILKTHSYDVIISNPLFDNVTETYSYTLTSEQMPSSVDEDDDLRNHRFRKNNDFYRTSVRSLSKNSYFFPATGLYNLSCVLVNSTNPMMYQCKFGSNVSVEDGVSRMQPSREHFRTGLFLVNNNDTNNMLLATGLSNWNAANQPAVTNETVNATCNDVYTQEGRRVTISVPLRNPDRIIQLSSCRARCLVTAPREEVCSNLKTEEVYDIGMTFWSYLSIRVFIGMIGGTAFAMFEGAVIAILREQSADYGLQRIYATIGGMISSPLSGLLIDYASRGKGYTDFRPAFYLYAGLKIASGLLMLTMNLEFKAPATNVVADVMTVLRNIEIVALFIAIFVLGTAWGYIESFLFWLLQDLGASRSLMGITITVGGVAGIPLLVLSGPIIDKIGHANVLFIGFIFYAIRLFGYSLIYNPWLCLIFEAMESVTSSLSFTAAVTYAAKLSSPTTDSSIQGLLGGLYFGVGKGAGSLIGGYMMKAFGTRPTYRAFAVACAITGVVYFLFNKFYLSKRPQVEGNDIVKKKVPVIEPIDLVEVDVISLPKGKELDKETNANNNRAETIPINTTASKSYSSANNSTRENNAKNNECPNKTRESNLNLGYDAAGDDHVTMDREQDGGNSDSTQVQKREKDTNDVNREKQNESMESEKHIKDSQRDGSVKDDNST